MREQQNQFNLLGNLNNAYGAMTAEADKVYEDQMRKYQIDSQAKAQLRQSGMGNIFGGANDAAGMFMQLGQQGQQNQFNKQYLKAIGG
jgi:hypothetical protein